MKTEIVKSKFSTYINIGGCPYFRKAKLSGWHIFILAATDTRLSIENKYNEQEWIELDNDQLELCEKFEKALY